jgi:hypothetical protein
MRSFEEQQLLLDGTTSEQRLFTLEEVNALELSAVENERSLIASRIKNEITRASNPMLVDREYLDGLEAALEIVKGENK